MPPKKKPKTFRQIALDLLWPALQMSGLVFFSWLNATHFDQTELKMLVEFAAYWKVISAIQDKVD